MIASIFRKTVPVLISGGLWYFTLGAASFAAESDSDAAEAPAISLFDGIRSGSSRFQPREPAATR